MKPLLFLFFVIFFFLLASYLLPTPKKRSKAPTKERIAAISNAITVQQLRSKAAFARHFVLQKHFSGHYAFLIDMRLPSGRKRFFIYDLQRNSVLAAGLVAHGSCNNRFLKTAKFSNTPGCGCTALGKYKVGGVYQGQFGKSFKLQGLDSTNSNADNRNIVLHAYGCVPDEECYPHPICNSLGCATVSPNVLGTLSRIIEKEKSPVLLWVFE